MGYIISAILFGVGLFGVMFYENYRKRVPTARHLFEHGLRYRQYLFPQKSELYLEGEKIPWFERLFVHLDISDLRKAGRLGQMVIYYKHGEAIEETDTFKKELDHFLELKEVAWLKTQGHPERMPRLLCQPPFDYFEEVFFEKVPPSIRHEMSF